MKNIIEFLKKYKKIVFILIVFLFIAVGGVLIIFGVEFLKDLGNSLITSAIVSLIWTYFVSEFDEEIENQKNDERLKKIEELINSNNKRQSEINEMGLRHIYNNRSYLTNNIECILKSAKSSIKILGESLNSFLDKPEFEKNLEEILQKKIKIEMILCSLNAPVLDERYKELELNKAESIGIHKKALRTYYKYCKKYGKNFKLRLFKYHPKLLMIIIDEKHVFVQHYAYGMKGYEAPLLEFNKSKLEVEKLYCKIFNNVWMDKETIDAKNEETQFK